MFSIAEV